MVFTDEEKELYRAIARGFNTNLMFMRHVTSEFLNTEADKIVQRAKSFDHDKIGKAEALAKEVADTVAARYRAIESKQVNKILRERQKLEQAKLLAEKEQIASEAKIELERYVDTLITSKTLTDSQLKSLKYFKSIYLDGKRDSDVSHLFRGTTRDQRYQWKTRAIKMIAPYVSDTAKKYISERTKIKYAAVAYVVKIANKFDQLIKGKS